MLFRSIMRPRRRALALHAKRDQPMRRPVLLRVHENLTANEFWFLQVHEKPQAGFDWVVLRRKIGAIERITHFQTKRVARSKPAWFNPKLCSFFEHEVPKLYRVAGAKEYFDAVFARVTRPRHRDWHSIELKIDNPTPLVLRLSKLEGLDSPYVRMLIDHEGRLKELLQLIVGFQDRINEQNYKEILSELLGRFPTIYADLGEDGLRQLVADDDIPF